MSDFQTFIANCKLPLENQSASRADTFLRASAVRWLKELSGFRTLFMEDVFSFSTVADQAEYGSGDAGFPTNAMEFDSVYVEVGTGANSTRYIIEGPVPIDVVRRGWLITQRGDDFVYSERGKFPTRFAWHHNKMILDPIPSEVLSIKGDYLKDATKDSNGVVITTASTTATNGWLDRGERALMNAVLWDYYSLIAKDAEAATLCQGHFEHAKKIMHDEWNAKAMRAAQASYVYGGDDD